MLKEAKLALFDGQFVLIFKVLLRVNQTLSRVFGVTWQNSNANRRRLEASLDVGPVEQLEVTLGPLEGRILKVIDTLRMHYLHGVFLRLGEDLLGLLENGHIIVNDRRRDNRGGVSILLLQRTVSVFIT